MTRAVKAYVRAMDATSRVVGNFVMYWVCGMMAILLFETISRTIFNHPHIWAVEFSQFVMAAYYMLGGCYSFLIEGHVRMDILYSRWSAKRKAVMDLITFPLILFYLVILLIGGFHAVHYAWTYKQVSYSSWMPPLTPIKILMVIGVVLMLLQVISEFFKDMARARGEEIKHEL